MAIFLQLYQQKFGKLGAILSACEQFLMSGHRYREILANLSSDSLILTVNQRLAAYLKSEFASLQNASAWQQPKILPLATWLRQFWNLHSETTNIVLSDFAEFLAWQRIIKQYAQEHPLIQIQNTALLAGQAWQLAQSYQIDLQAELAEANEEIQNFCTWSTEFENILEQQAAHSSAQIPALVLDLIQTQKPPLPREIILVGFDDLAPIYQELINTLKSKGCAVRYFQPDGAATEVQRIGLLDQKDEIETMARWANQAAKAHPEKIIACLVPNLNVIRDQVASVFRKICDQPVNLTAGKALSHYPIIQAALDFLSLNIEKIERDLISKILMSIYHSNLLTDRSICSKVDSELQSYISTHLSCEKILHEIKRQSQAFAESSITPRFIAYFAELSAAQTRILLPSEWIEVFQTILKSLDWPSKRPLNSENYQVVCRWQELWPEFAALNEITGKIDYFSALAVLKNLSLQIIFQQKRPKTNIHVLGLLESGGIEFDQIWLMGLDDETWPPKIKPNPFLPLNLQREKNMPHASSEREITYSLKTQERLLNCCSKLIISYPQKDGDKKLHASRLIDELHEIDKTQLKLAEYKSDLQICAEQQIEIEALNDEYAPAVSSDEITRGGSWILQEQALCPFRAFVRIRLKAKIEGEKSLGIDGKERGNLTHAVLESVWKALKTQSALNKLSPIDLSALLNEKIEQALNLNQDIEPDFCAIEKKRLHELVNRWLDLEKQRPPFTVLEQETQRFIQIGDLKLQVKIDRIDELENEKILIIDYKTGAEKPISGWLNERLTEAQLPLYASYAATQSHGIAYAQVKSGNNKLVGLIDEEDSQFLNLKLPEKADEQKRNWPHLINDWRNNLLQLSKDFMQGVARVDPAANACTYCDLQAVCRIGSNENESI